MPTTDDVLVLRALAMDHAQLLAEGYCCRVYATDDLVVRIPFQGEEFTTGGLAAVRLSGSIGATVLHHDPANGVLLMERLRPGNRLSQADLGDELELPWFGRFQSALRSISADGMMPLADYVDSEHPLARKLLATQPELRFLHGDLHHDNVLSDGSTWRLIDPKGLFGDPSYEAVAWLRNPIERIGREPDLVALLRRRVLWMHEHLGLDPWRMTAWGLVDSWGNEDPDHPWSRLPVAYQQLMRELG